MTVTLGGGEWSFEVHDTWAKIPDEIVLGDCAAVGVDSKDNVYAFNRGDHPVAVFDSDGNFKSQFSGVGSPLAMCITSGPTQYLYISHAGDKDGMEDAAILKVSLDGKVVGKFGSAGRQLKQFGLANSLDCRSENELLVGEMTNWRVQKVSLKK